MSSFQSDKISNKLINIKLNDSSSVLFHQTDIDHKIATKSVKSFAKWNKIEFWLIFLPFKALNEDRKDQKESNGIMA